MNNSLIVGCGDIGRRVAHLEIEQGNSVCALVRSEQGAKRLIDLGIDPIKGDLDSEVDFESLPSNLTSLYYFAPPPSSGIDDPRINKFLSCLAGRSHIMPKIIYISTSGVYGDCHGEWVDEDHPLNPLTDRAKRRYSAEQFLIEFSDATGAEIVILRVPGIYGPGRLPIDRIQKGFPVIREDEAPYSNRIHSVDLANACIEAKERGVNLRAYNITDGNPTTMTDYFFQVSDFLKLPRPIEIPLTEARKQFSPNLLSFIDESRRISNLRMLVELGVCLRYPTLLEGLEACWEPEATAI